MPIDPRARRFFATLAAMSSAQPDRSDITERRASFARLMGFCSRSPEAVDRNDLSISGPGRPLTLRLYVPPDGGRAGLIYFHGGGLVSGTIETHDALCARFADEIGCRVVSVDYRLAPEHRFPAAVSDCLAATIWTLENAAVLGIDPGNVAVGGDSAGATLAAVVSQLVSRQGFGLAYQLLLCPILDHAGETASRRDLADDPLINHAVMSRDLESYLPKHVSRADPLVSPLHTSDLVGLPRAYIHTAEFDPLRDEGREYADRLVASGVDVSYTCHAGMIHLFYALGSIIPAADCATARIAQELRSRKPA
jgi:acetyl esterase/lipase